MFAVNANEAEPVLRSSEIRCVVRHEPIARVEGSTLRYPDQVLPVADLGGAKVPGWEARDALPDAPRGGQPAAEGAPDAPRPPRARRQAEARRATGSVRDEYQELVERIKLIARSAVPPDATVVVVSKGDDQLLDLECGDAWHFPASPDGTWVGYNPPDAAWAIAAARAGAGARRRLPLAARDRLLVAGAVPRIRQAPADKECPQIVEDESCAIYTLCRFPALYGREREDIVRSHQRAVTELVREAPGPIPAPAQHE